jgi:hypothetical protein
MRQGPITPDHLRSSQDNGVDTLLMILIGLALLASALVWLVGQVAALAFGSHHLIHLGLSDMPGVIFQLAEHAGDPRMAYPPPARVALPGPVGMYAALILALALPTTVLVLLLAPEPAARRRSTGAGGRPAGSCVRCGFVDGIGCGAWYWVAGPGGAGWSLPRRATRCWPSVLLARSRPPPW